MAQAATRAARASMRQRRQRTVTSPLRAMTSAVLLLCVACSQTSPFASRPSASPVPGESVPAASVSPSVSDASPDAPTCPIRDSDGPVFAIIAVAKFSPSTASIEEPSLELLDQVAAVMVKMVACCWFVNVKVEGWIAKGERPGLGLERANAVIKALVARGVRERQLVAVDHGTATRPAGPQHVVTFGAVEILPCALLESPDASASPADPSPR